MTLRAEDSPESGRRYQPGSAQRIPVTPMDDAVTAAGRVLAQFEAEALPHLDDLFRTAVHLLRDRSQASDAVQDTFLRAWKAFDRYQPGTNCRAWLFKILLNVVRNERRKWFKWLTGNDEDFASLPLTAPEPVPTELTDHKILAALDSLSTDFREVLLLVDVQEFSYKEAGEILRIPIGTVMSRLSRARSHLRGQLTDTAYGIAAPREQTIPSRPHPRPPSASFDKSEKEAIPSS